MQVINADKHFKIVAVVVWAVILVISIIPGALVWIYWTGANWLQKILAVAVLAVCMISAQLWTLVMVAVNIEPFFSGFAKGLLPGAFIGLVTGLLRYGAEWMPVLGFVALIGVAAGVFLGCRSCFQFWKDVRAQEEKSREYYRQFF